MRNLITTGSALALLACMAPDGTGSTAPSEPAKTPETKPAPGAEAPKTMTQMPGGQTVKTTSPSPAPATGKTHPAPAPAKTEAKKPAPAKTAAKKVEAPPKRRESKIAPIQAKLVALLQKGTMTVQALAAKLDCTELQVRQAIDRARAGQGPEAKINRVARNTFGYTTPKRPAK